MLSLLAFLLRRAFPAGLAFLPFGCLTCLDTAQQSTAAQAAYSLVAQYEGDQSLGDSNSSSCGPRPLANLTALAAVVQSPTLASRSARKLRPAAVPK